MTDIALDEKLLPCPHCGGKEHEIGVGDAGHSITCHSFSCRSSTGRWHTRDQAIAAWNRRASPSQVAPANPAQVTDALPAHVDRAMGIIQEHFDLRRSDLLAAIGAGGQAVAYEPCGGCGEKNPDKRCIGCLHPFSALAQPHPADERVVEALTKLRTPPSPIQKLGAAISRRDWHEAEQAHALIRDALDGFAKEGQ